MSRTTPMGTWCCWWRWRRTRTGRTCPDMSNILFGVAVAVLIASLAGAVWSAAVPGRRIWPPPGRRSWQYFLTWAGFCAVCGINLLLLLIHWNSWVFQSPLRFVVGIPLALLGGRRHASVASAESHSVTSPRWTKACSYADQFPTRYFVLYFGWTFDLMPRSCTRSGHRGQRAYSCLVAAEGLCTNACAGKARSRGTRCRDVIFETLFETLWVTNPIRPRSAASRNRVMRGPGVTQGAKRSQGVRRPRD